MVQKTEDTPGEFSRFWGETGGEGKKCPAVTGGWASFGMDFGEVVTKMRGHSMTLLEVRDFGTIKNNGHGRPLGCK